jgi:hypothetical protein
MSQASLIEYAKSGIFFNAVKARVVNITSPTKNSDFACLPLGCR